MDLQIDNKDNDLTVEGTIGSDNARRIWKRPEWRKVDAGDAQADINANTDGPAFS